MRELWIVNLRSDVILVFREPADGAYRRTLTPGRGDTIAVAAFPEDVFRVEDVIGQLHHFETPS